MREIIVDRPRKFACAARKVRLAVDGRKVGVLKNGQRAVMQLDNAAHTIRVTGGWASSKSFRDEITIPAGMYGYTLRMDFVSIGQTAWRPVLRLCSLEQICENNDAVTNLGAQLARFLLNEEIRAQLRRRPDARLRLVIGPRDWRVLLVDGEKSTGLMQMPYEVGSGGWVGGVLSMMYHGTLDTEEGRRKILDLIMNEYALLPDYERVGEDLLRFRG